jgi:hypothetical protein
VHGAERPSTYFPFWHRAFAAAVLVAKTLEVMVLVTEIVAMRLSIVVASTREVTMVVSKWMS